LVVTEGIPYKRLLMQRAIIEYVLESSLGIGIKFVTLLIRELLGR
jgi:hypothetical protein